MTALGLAHLLAATGATALAVTAFTRSGRSSLLWAVVQVALTIAAWNAAHGLLMLTRDDGIRVLAPSLAPLPLAAFLTLALRSAAPRAPWRRALERGGWTLAGGYALLTFSALLLPTSRAFVLSPRWNLGFVAVALPFVALVPLILWRGVRDGGAAQRALCLSLAAAGSVGVAAGLTHVLPPERPLELGSLGMLLAVVMGAVAVVQRHATAETIALKEILAMLGGVAAIVVSAVLVVSRAPGYPVASGLGLAALGIAALTAYRWVQRRWQRRLEEAARLAALGRATSVLAHEVRNPLTTVQGVLDILGEELRRCERHADSATYLDLARSEIGRVVELLQDCLSYARAPAPAWERFDLRVLLERVVQAARLRHADAEVALEPGPALDVVADSGQLTRLFENLVVNACQSRDGAHVRVRVARQDVRTAVVWVDDDGPGVEAALRERVFEPFYTTKLRGGGLGLAIVREIAVRHGGRVTVERSDAGGARLVVQLARDPQQEVGA